MFIIIIQIFEKVLVQNIQFGLSPSLTSALHSIPRLVKSRVLSECVTYQHRKIKTSTLKCN